MNKTTIKAKVGYKVRRIKNNSIPMGFIDEFGYDIPCLLFDGDDVIMIAGLRTYTAYRAEVHNGGNEVARLCEIFETLKGNVFAYWRDEETDEDFLTKLT